MTAPMPGNGFIAELCEALVHRWEPERGFMVLTGYFDESGTHAGSPLSLMAGFLGNARQWKKFEKRAGKLFARYRVDVFHSIDLKRTDKDFVGWSVDKKIEFMDEFYHVVNETMERGIVAILKNEDWEYYKALDWPSKARMDSRYTLMFRAIMGTMIKKVLESQEFLRIKEPRLHVVLESGHKNAPDTLRCYEAIRAMKPFTERVLAGLTFQTKVGCLPLAAADLLAYGSYYQETGGKPLGTAKKPLKSDASYRKNFDRIVMTRDSLKLIHEQTVAIADGTFSSSGQPS